MINNKTNYMGWRELRNEHHHLISDFSSTKRHKFSLMFITKKQNSYIVFKLNMGLLNPATNQNSVRALLNTNNSFGDAVYNSLNQLNLIKYITLLNFNGEKIMTNLKVAQIQCQDFNTIEEIMNQFDIDNWEHKEIENSPHFTLNKIDNKQVIFSKLIIDFDDNESSILFKNIFELFCLKDVSSNSSNHSMI